MWIAFLLVVLVGAVVSLERTITLHKGKIRSGDFVAGIVNLLKKERAVEALSLCEDTPGPVAQTVKVGLLNMRKSSAEYHLAIQGAASSIIPLLEKRVNTIAFLSRIAQLMGLLGAVLALREPYVQMSENAVGLISSQQLASASVEAFGFIAAGLVVSIVFYAIYHLLNGRVRALVAEMERAAIEVQAIGVKQEA